MILIKGFQEFPEKLGWNRPIKRTPRQSIYFLCTVGAFLCFYKKYMEKTSFLFDSWNQAKKNLELGAHKNINVRIWELWVAKIWVNIGSELSKDWEFLRPVMIIANHMWWDLVLIVPITTKYNDHYKKYLMEITNYQQYWLNEKSYFSLNNIKTISKKRLMYRLNGFKKERYRKLFSEKFINDYLLKQFCEIIKKSP